jgi:hypothetical protein
MQAVFAGNDATKAWRLAGTSSGASSRVDRGTVLTTSCERDGSSERKGHRKDVERVGIEERDTERMSKESEKQRRKEAFT